MSSWLKKDKMCVYMTTLSDSLYPSIYPSIYLSIHPSIQLYSSVNSAMFKHHFLHLVSSQLLLISLLQSITP